MEISSQHSKWGPLEGYISRIETYRDKDGVLVLENCKALVESICKTILEDLGESIAVGENLNNLVSKTCNKLACLPNTGELARSFVTVANKLGEFRNSFSEIGHGRSVYQLEENRKKVTLATTQFMIATIEQLAVFLITVYQEEYPQHIQKQLRYEDNQGFNERFDEENNLVQIGDYGPYSPSEVLFLIEKNAYITALTDNT